MIAVAFNIITNLILIPPYGYQAAALTTIASEAVLLCRSRCCCAARWETIPWLGMVWRPVVAAAAMFVALALRLGRPADPGADRLRAGLRRWCCWCCDRSAPTNGRG